MPSTKKPSAASNSSPALVRATRNYEKLKAMAINATEFSEPMAFFMDEFAPDPVVMKLGKLSKDKAVKAVFQCLCQSLGEQFNPQGIPANASLVVVGVDKFNLFHGGGMVGNLMLTMVYFQDIDMGLAAMVQAGSSQTIFSRFSAKQFTPASGATFVPNDGQVKH